MLLSTLSPPIASNPDAKPKPILTTVVKAIKHAYAVADHRTPIDKSAFATTAKNSTSTR
ncbi:hypothetical protein AGMMS49921_02060 [Endomicrobiia bacterium]|nr:hypothetical protein AGMMS49921_02060 [Endomicrobiia bacterium]